MSAPPRTMGGYTIEAKLGAGGMGAVYRATHPRAPGHSFALKVLLVEESPTAEQADRFTREMHALGSLTHPNIVKIVGGGIDQKRPFFVMELVQGTSLSRLGWNNPLEPRRAVTIVRAVADAVAFIHANGIIHRDLKPENIMIEAGDRPRILDFGLAKVAETHRLTRSGVVLGTPAYSAPEQIDGGAHTVDGTADVYALGAVLWFALAGRPPFVSESSVALLKNVLVQPPDPPSKHAPGLPTELDAICLHALEKDPKKRYASAAELCEDLDRFLRGEPLRAPALGSLDELARVARRREVKAGLRGIGVAALVIPAAFGAFLYHRHVEAQRREGSFQAGMSPSATVIEVEQARKAFVEDGGDAPRVQALDRRRLERILQDRLGEAHGQRTVKALTDAATAAIAAPWSASLVGEAVPGLPRALEGFALGEALLVARDALVGHRTLTAAALPAEVGAIDSTLALLAESRLAALAADPVGRALRAYAALAKTGAPRALFGPGRPEDVSPSVLDDLAAARALKGPAGVHAAWLLADLLVAAPHKDREAREAIAAASKLEERPDDRASLERALAAPAGAKGYASLASRLEDPKGLPRAAFELNRFLVRHGLRDALEHPEVAGMDPLKPEVSFVLALESPRRWVPARTGDWTMDPAAQAEFDRVYALGELSDAEQDRGDKGVELRRARVKPEVDALRKLALEQIAKHGARFDILYELSHWKWESLVAAVYDVLVGRIRMAKMDSLAESFSAEVRELTRSGYTSDLYIRELWEIEGRPGLEVCARFDDKLDTYVAADPFLPKLVGHGLEQKDVDLAVTAVKGLRRLEELAEQKELAPAERHELAFACHEGLDALARLGGHQVLGFRAMLRKLAYARPLGTALARLDLERAEWVARGTWIKDDPRGDYDGYAWSHFPELCAAIAAREPGPLVALEARLFDLSVAWARQMLMRALALAPPEDRERIRKQDFEQRFQGADGKETVRILQARIEAAKKEGSLYLDAADVKDALSPGFRDEFRAPAVKPVARSLPR